ncbi:redoxin domain-containing protein [bacterium]|nr:MAG: redoxin domain-containing protein [bacterium]
MNMDNCGINKKSGVSAFLVLFVLSAALLVAPVKAESKRGIDVGESIPARELDTRVGEKLTVPAADGLTVLVFWSTWSPRSEPALALWKKFKEEYSDHNVQVVAINADHQEMTSEDLEKVDAFVQENNVGLPVHVDENLDLYNEIGIIVVPTTVFLHNDGKMVYKYTSFPTSAAIDLKQDLEKELGIAVEPEVEETVAAEPEYVPKNNALLYFSLGRRLHDKGFADKARDKYVTALQKDPDYVDPLRALESIYFAEGQTPEAEENLKSFLTENELEGQIEKIGQGEVDTTLEEEVKPGAEGTVEEPAQEENKELSPMERMKLLMGGSSPDAAGTEE